MKNTLKLVTISLVLGLLATAHGAAIEAGDQKPWVRLSAGQSAFTEQMNRSKDTRLSNDSAVNRVQAYPAKNLDELRDLGIPYELVQSLESGTKLDFDQTTLSFWHVHAKPGHVLVPVGSENIIILKSLGGQYVCIDFDLSTAVLRVQGST